MCRFFVVAAFMLIVTLPAFSQQNSLTQTVKGRITDAQSGTALSSATVSVEGENNNTVLADRNGDFKIENVSIGRKTVRISLMGYEDAVVSNIELTSSKEVVLEIKLIEKIKKLDEVIIKAGKPKNKALNEAAVVSARQFSVDEAVRYSGTRNDPSRMAQNFAGVSGGNDARNDIIIRGNSPAGVLWRMDGVDIPNPNHYSTLGSTGGPVTILNTNTLKNSDFITSAFPAQYGNAIAGVFDLNMRNGNNEKYEFLGQMGFNGFEFGAEGPLSKKSKASFLVNYRYSLVAVIQKVGLTVGTGSATPYYQDINFKINIPVKKGGVFSLFGLGGESHIKFEAQDDDNLYSTNDGSLRERKFNSITGILGLTHTYFFNPATSGRVILAASGLGSQYREDFYNSTRINKTAFYKKNTQLKYTAGYIFNKKINTKNRITSGITADLIKLKLRNDYIPDGDSVLFTFFDTNKNTALIRGFTNYAYRFSDKLSTNIGLYYQVFTLNNSMSLEPRMNIKYQVSKNQSLSLGAGLHSQIQPLEVYFYKTKTGTGDEELSNKELQMVKTSHVVVGYDVNFSKTMRLKAEVYGQYIFNAAVEKNSSSFSMLNAGADFYFPDKTNLVNDGKGHNYGAELTIEKFLDKGFYYLVTASVFQSEYKGSDNIWRNTAFNSNFAINILAGKEFVINSRSSFGIDTKLTSAGGQRYSPFDLAASEAAGYVIFKEKEAYSLQHSNYLRWDLKFSYTKNGRKATQKWYVDLQNLSSRNNIYIRTLNPKSGKESIINQIGFFPNINYSITF